MKTGPGRDCTETAKTGLDNGLYRKQQKSGRTMDCTENSKSQPDDERYGKLKKTGSDD